MAPTDGDDRLLRAVYGEPPLRLVAARTTATCREGAGRHGVQGAAAVALGRGLTAAALMATLTKGNERVTIQVIGNGPLRGVTVDGNDMGEVRGFIGAASPKPIAGVAAARLRLTEALGDHGEVVVHRDLGLKEVYQGRTDLPHGEVDLDLEAYLARSEQIPSLLRCDVLLGQDGQIAQAGGILVQTTPGADADELRPLAARLDTAWLVQRLLGGVAVGTWLTDLADTDVRVLEWRAVRFRCRCDTGRVEGALATLGPAELQDMIETDGQAEVICRFCSQAHIVPGWRLAEIASALRAQAEGSAG